MKRRVVVTGSGLVTPLGTGTEKTWKNLCDGKSGIGNITRFDTSDYAVKIAAEVKDFNPQDFIEPKLARHLDPFVQYAVAAAGMALKEAGLIIDDANATRVGVFTGNGIGGLSTIEKYHKISLERGPRKITPFFIPMVISNLSAGQISIVFGVIHTILCFLLFPKGINLPFLLPLLIIAAGIILLHLFCRIKDEYLNELNK